MEIKECIYFFEKLQKNPRPRQVLEDFSYWLGHYMIYDDFKKSVFGISFLWTEKMTYKNAKSILTEIKACNEELAYNDAEPKGVLLYQYKMRFILKCATIYQYMSWSNMWEYLLFNYVWTDEGLPCAWSEGDALSVNVRLNDIISCSYDYDDIVSFLEGILKNE